MKERESERKKEERGTYSSWLLAPGGHIGHLGALAEAVCYIASTSASLGVTTLASIKEASMPPLHDLEVSPLLRSHSGAGS